MRVYVTHAARNQPWQTQEGETLKVDFDSGRGVPSWELRVEGKLLPKVSDSLTSARVFADLPNSSRQKRRRPRSLPLHREDFPPS